MWRDLLTGLDPEAGLRAPTDPAAVAATEAALGQPLPRDLVQLLLETDGVTGRFGAALVWPVERIAYDNRRMRHSPDLADRFMPFDALLFFADDGADRQYAVVRRPCRDDVFVWDRHDDSRTWFAPRLEGYLRRVTTAAAAR